MGKALITGVTGQDGAYLSKLLLEKGYEVHGGVRTIGVNSGGRLDELGIRDKIELHELDLLEFSNIQKLIEAVRPDEIYNLAAQSFVAASFRQPIYTTNVDGLGAIRLLEAIRAVDDQIRFYQASSSEMYGKVRETPQTELTPFHPRSPYAVAKLCAHFATINYRESYCMFACSGILFNHESPLRGSDFVTRKVTRGLAQIEAGTQEILELGNINAERDWGFAGDYVEGMWRMLQADQPDDYVIAAGKSRSIREFVQTAAKYFGWDIEWSGSGLEEVGFDRGSGRVLIRINPEFYRPADVDSVVGDARKARENLGWSPVTEFDELVGMMVAADRDRVRRGRFFF